MLIIIEYMLVSYHSISYLGKEQLFLPGFCLKELV